MKIAIVGNYGAKNSGDELILSGLLSIVKKAAPKAEITVFSADPAATTRQHQIHSVRSLPGGLRSFFRYLFLNTSTRQTILESDCIILGGGGLFASIKKRANLIWAIPALLTFYHGKKLIIYGQSLEKIPGPFIRALIKKIFEKAVLITVRDRRSQEILERIGIRRDAILLPDLAFALKILAPPHLQKTIAVALRNSRVLKPSSRRAIADFLDWLISEHKWQVQFFSFQEGAHDDHKLHQQVVALMKHGSQCRYIKHLPQTACLLGMPLHAIIYSTLTTTPFIALPYATKVQSFLDDAGLTDLSLNLDQISFENLCQKFEFLQKNSERITASLTEYVKKAQHAHEEMAQKLAVIFEQTLI